MKINNFLVVEQFMKFQEGSYYKFEALIRNTDGANPLYYEGMSKTNQNIHIKSWYIDTLDYYEKAKHEMCTLCDMTGARLYLTLDRKSTKKTLIEIHKEFSNRLYSTTYGDRECLTIKKISKQFASKSSVVETSDSDCKTMMFDVDTKDELIINSLKEMLAYYNIPFWVLDTKKGFHVVIERKMGSNRWKKGLAMFLQGNKGKYEKILDNFSSLDNLISLKPNELGLVYMNTDTKDFCKVCAEDCALENTEMIQKLKRLLDNEKHYRYQAEAKLEKLKPILEYYKDSHIGELQHDGTYRCEIEYKKENNFYDYTILSDEAGSIHSNAIVYDPRPAKEGLEIMEAEIMDKNKKLEGVLYEKLLELVSPRLFTDSCGYNEETHSFDIILALKEILEYLENEKEA